MNCRAFQAQSDRRVLRRTAFYCMVLTVLSLISDMAVAQTLTSDVGDNSTQGLFDPNGYYFPMGANLIFGGWKIEWMDIQSVEYYYDNELHYGRPRAVLPVVRLTLTRQKDQKRVAYKCPEPVISQEILSVVCPATPIGSVSIRGGFSDKRGQFWNRNEIIPYKTVVLNATVTIKNRQGTRFSRQLRFTYWEGD